MSEGRRGFLTKLFGGAAGITVSGVAASAAAKAATETKNPPIQQSNGSPFDIMDMKKWPSWKSLRDKVKKGELLSHMEAFQLAAYMNRSRNGALVMLSYSELQKHQANLVRVHPMVSDCIVTLATGKSFRRQGVTDSYLKVKATDFNNASDHERRLFNLEDEMLDL